MAAETLFAQIEAIIDDGEADVEAIRQLLTDHAEQAEAENGRNNAIFLSLVSR